MHAQVDTYPVVLMQDRYTGTYSGGRWLALANADELVDEINTRAQFCLCGVGGPHDGDVEAARFWSKRPEWIAVGGTPQEALEALRNQMTAAAEHAVQLPSSVTVSRIA